VQVNKSNNKIPFKKSIWVSKNAEFQADVESVEKVLKKCTKKVISKNVRGICIIFTFTHVRQTCFAYNLFLVHFLKTFSKNSKSAQNYGFLISFLIFSKKIGHISTFLKLRSQTRKKRLKKSKNIFCKCVLVSIFHPSKGLCSPFSKKQSNPSAHTYFFEVFFAGITHCLFFQFSYA
jgi:hypothetical protein